MCKNNVRVVVSVLVLLLLFLIPSQMSVGDTGICGDINGDGIGPNVADLTYLVQYLFAGGAPLPYQWQGNVNGVWPVNIGDLTYLVAYLFAQGLDLACIPPIQHSDVAGGCITEPYNRGSIDYETVTGECREMPGRTNPFESMFAQLSGNDLHVYHLNAFTQCCLMYDVTFDIYGSSIMIYEQDTMVDPCPCECYFNLEVVIYDLDLADTGIVHVYLTGLDGNLVGMDSIMYGDPEYMRLDVIGNDLYVNHLNAFYQCCLGYYVDYSIDDFQIVAQEADTGSLCDCYCYFNLQSVLYDLPDGSYDFTLIHENGDTVGVDTFTIEAGPVVRSILQSDCVDTVRGDVQYDYWSNLLTLTHFNALFNCGGIVDVDFVMVGDTLRFYEHNVSDEWAYCECYFEVQTVVGPIPDGEYVAEVYTRDWPDEPYQLVDRRVVYLY